MGIFIEDFNRTFNVVLTFPLGAGYRDITERKLLLNLSSPFCVRFSFMPQSSLIQRVFASDRGISSHAGRNDNGLEKRKLKTNVFFAVPSFFFRGPGSIAVNFGLAALEGITENCGFFCSKTFKTNTSTSQNQKQLTNQRKHPKSRPVPA